MRKLITEVAGVIGAPPEKVMRELRATIPAHGTVEVGDRSLSIQGGWWYRGEWHASPHPEGTLLVHRVYNVAQWMRWGVPLANKFFIGFRETTRDGFAQGIAEIGRRLGVPARLKTG
ncbi:hypothetical protein [Thermoactinospora rubra]|uniref:hypothetical protein n=1 Tax=Thermoactinospora rubra TaxID=1088767 RepID=UPI00198109CF|nr:hypothetical protein [Thermoactinospora rubra]